MGTTRSVLKTHQEFQDRGQLPSFRVQPCLQKSLQAYLVLWEVGPLVFLASQPQSCLSPHKSFIEDFSEVWMGSTLVFFLDMGHVEKVSPRVAPRN